MTTGDIVLVSVGEKHWPGSGEDSEFLDLRGKERRQGKARMIVAVYIPTIVKILRSEAQKNRKWEVGGRERFVILGQN